MLYFFRLVTAELNNNFEEMSKIQKQIDQLNEKIELEKKIVEKAAKTQVSLNKRNKENNFKKDLTVRFKKILF